MGSGRLVCSTWAQTLSEAPVNHPSPASPAWGTTGPGVMAASQLRGSQPDREKQGPNHQPVHKKPGIKEKKVFEKLISL